MNQLDKGLKTLIALVREFQKASLERKRLIYRKIEILDHVYDCEAFEEILKKQLELLDNNPG